MEGVPELSNVNKVKDEGGIDIQADSECNFTLERERTPVKKVVERRESVSLSSSARGIRDDNEKNLLGLFFRSLALCDKNEV